MGRLVRFLANGFLYGKGMGGRGEVGGRRRHVDREGGWMDEGKEVGWCVCVCVCVCVRPSFVHVRLPVWQPNGDGRRRREGPQTNVHTCCMNCVCV